MADEPRSWSLASAREIAVEVRRITAGAVGDVEALEARRARGGRGRRAAHRARAGARAGGGRLGARDGGARRRGEGRAGSSISTTARGYYCWRWPETRLDYFHGYDEGFAGRVRIQ